MRITADGKMISKAAIRLQNNVIFVAGELNFSNAGDIWKSSLSILAAQPKYVFDFSELSSSNSAGLALLLEWMKHAKSQKKIISFLNLPEQLVTLAKAVGLSSLIQ